MNEPLLNGLSWLLLIGGLLFFVAGSIGLLRFPDTVSRLHALTKADTLGLGLVIAGLSLRADSATACQLLARQAGEEPRDD